MPPRRSVRTATHRAATYIRNHAPCPTLLPGVIRKPPPTRSLTVGGLLDACIDSMQTKTRKSIRGRCHRSKGPALSSPSGSTWGALGNSCRSPHCTHQEGEPKLCPPFHLAEPGGIKCLDEDPGVHSASEEAQVARLRRSSTALVLTRVVRGTREGTETRLGPTRSTDVVT
ncbi:hypothetical protein L226DRAFT_87992 [Lentinus tigrinus ALCF2SS1-7]|uniref:uncharacterized protein n=1 Tax=Lentinus tigrinus ALCF2SS1-7 TaxID=1328758 RepID=UPI00116607EF|nr:hypothetical protein L226DRAFT_87992 [Lentinus tigrinus ALCF2SS1-7]